MTRRIFLLLAILLLATLGGRGSTLAQRERKVGPDPSHRPARPHRHDALIAGDDASFFANETSPASVEGSEESEDEPAGAGLVVALLPPHDSVATARDRGTPSRPARPAGLRRPLRC